MRIVAAGVSGFIGTRLLTALQEQGHQVVQLVRRKPNGLDEARWDPDAGEFDDDVLVGADAVINLCGVGVGDKRWTDAYRELIVTSRVKPTELVAAGCAKHRVPVLVNASAVGIYGYRGDEELTERSDPGDDFFGHVCRRWEEATRAATDGGTRVVNLRTGLVLGHEGGLLSQLSVLTKLFLGGRLGSGQQWNSWIAADDEVAAIVFLLTADVSGPVNLTAPHPVRNAELSRAIGRALGRPAPWAIPGFALHLAVGDFAEEILHGQKVLPAQLTRAGFTFRYPELAGALAAEVKR